jgi:hypothetical protein
MGDKLTDCGHLYCLFDLKAQAWKQKIQNQNVKAFYCGGVFSLSLF